MAKTLWNPLSDNALEVPEFRVQSVRELIGEGYDEYWWWPGRYAVCRGSRASKKSYTTAYWIILNMMEHPLANTLVVRKVSGTNKDSTFALLEKVIYHLGLENRWKAHISPLELIYLPTGQKILFRGLDEPQKLSSVTATHGVLCWMWIEEAYQITDEKDFDIVDQSIRGDMPPDLHPRIMITFNPWHKEHWLKRRFFDNPDSETLAMRTDYRCNEWLTEFDKKYFEDLKERNPRLYQVAGLGDWGVSEGLIYTDWEERDFEVSDILKRKHVEPLFGLDFGFTDPTAFVASVLDRDTRTIYVYDEWYQRGVSNIDIANKIKEMGYANARIVCDSASPQSIYELQTLGISGAVGAIKAGDSVEWGIQKCQQYHVVIHSRCVDFLLEISMYAYDQDKMGKLMNKPCHDFSHCLIEGTLVLTENGYKPIEDVEVGERVQTHLGLRTVTASGITQFNAEVYLMTLEDGTQLIGTGDHPVVTSEGIINLKDISERIEVVKWVGESTGPSEGKNRNSMGRFGTDTLIQNMNAIGRISNTEAIGCTDMSGNSITGQSPKAIRYTTSTITPQTTISQILCAYRQRNIRNNTLGQRRDTIHRGRYSHLSEINAEYGTNQMKVANGIQNMHAIRNSKIRNSYASNVESISSQNHTVRSDSVQTTVNLSSAENRVLTTRLEFVRNVVRNSQQTNIPKQDVVLVHVESVIPLGIADRVYDLTVDEAHDFYANGILTLNCMDAWRYSVMELLYRDGESAGLVVGPSADSSSNEIVRESQRRGYKNDDNDENDDDTQWVF